MRIRTNQGEPFFFFVYPWAQVCPFASVVPAVRPVRVQGCSHMGPGLVLLCHLPRGYSCCVLSVWAGVAMVCGTLIALSTGPAPPFVPR